MEEIQKYIDLIIGLILKLDFTDHVLLGVSLFFGILFLFLGFEKLQKAYLGIILGLFLFSLINLTLFSLNDNDIGINGFRDYFIKNRSFLSLYSIYLIPIFAFILPFNNILNIKGNKIKVFNIILSFILGFFFIWFFITIILSIVNNRFLFSLNTELLESLKQIFFINFIFGFFSSSIIYPFLIKYDYIFNLTIILFIFYKLTFGGFFSFLFLLIGGFFKSIIKKNEEEKVKEKIKYDNEKKVVEEAKK